MRRVPDFLRRRKNDARAVDQRDEELPHRRGERHGRRVQIPVGRPDSERGSHLPHVVREASLREHDSLGVAGRPRREHDVGGVRGADARPPAGPDGIGVTASVPVHSNCWDPRLREKTLEFRLRDQRVWGRLSEDRFEPRRRKCRVERNPCRAGLEHTEYRDCKIHCPLETDPNPGVAHGAEASQSVSQKVALPVELLIAEAPAVSLDRNRVRRFASRPAEDVGR